MKRAARPGGRTRRLLPLLLSAPLLAGACRRPEHPEVAAGRSVPLPAPVDSTASIAAGPAGRLWLAAGGRLAVLDTAGGPAAALDLEAPGPARFVGSDTAAVYLLAGTRLLAVAPDGGRVRARRGGVGEDGFAPDPGGGGYLATRGGGVLRAAPGTLEPVLGWPERGPPGTALAVSPLGDRVYQALGGEDPEVLTRDAQTGRVLARSEAGGEVRRLEAGPDGTLYALRGEGRRAALAALRPGPAGLEELWESTLRALDLDDSVRLAVSPAGTRLALVSAAGGGTLRVLDAATGQVVAGEGGVVDAAWAADGALLLLTPREVRVVRP
ncbi:MAG TPA: hypothetical protein VHG51_11070 [Longimicrobiaceae bacterium]|nr:hypothetical protein [Longimicrobiaceae bacterium]